MTDSSAVAAIHPGPRSEELKDQLQRRIIRRVAEQYDRNARRYDLHVGMLSLGLEKRFRAKFVKTLGLRPGHRVLDLACGSGLNFPALEAAIGPSGHILAVDLSREMLILARRRAHLHGWTNVTLLRADAQHFAPRQPVDAGICTLAIGLMPEPARAMRALVGSVKPGGPLLLADGRPIERWYGRLVNPLLRAAGRRWDLGRSEPAWKGGRSNALARDERAIRRSGRAR